MKRIFASVFAVLMAVTLSACGLSLKSLPGGSSSSRENRLSSPFQGKVSITLDRLEAEGTIQRFGDGQWETEFDSPNTLSGVKLSFGTEGEGTVTASYKGLSFSVPRAALPVKAMLLNLIEAVDSSARLEELSGQEKDGLLEIAGSLDGGDYVLTVDRDGMLSCFEMPGSKLKMTFTELTLSPGGGMQSAETQPSSVSTTD